MRVDRTRNNLLTDFGKATLEDRYLMPGEDYQDLFARVAKTYSNDDEQAQRIYDYISQLWFMPSTPILSNGGTDRGLPISCFLAEASDKMEGIVDTWVENVWLASKGGGIGTYWGNIRGIGEKIGKVGKSSGVVPFLKVQDVLTLAISQGSLRRGSAAVYLPIWHAEIEEFIEMRRATGGDPNRKCLNLHHGVVIDDEFMFAVENDEEYSLRSPKDNSVLHTVRARDLWFKLLTARIETGEPYIMFKDTVNDAIPEHHKKLGLEVKMSNLCSEITLPTGIDHLGNDRTAVCCLASVNYETYDQWKGNQQFVTDILYFLDNVLQDFIDNAPDTHKKAKYSAMRERSIGLGAMGLHGYYQSKNLAWGSEEAMLANETLHKQLWTLAQVASKEIAAVRGACPDALETGVTDIRFSNIFSIAPTASISIICGGVSPGCEPRLANYFSHKTLSGTFPVRNKYLEQVLEQHGKNVPAVWSSIATNEGSVQHLSFLTDNEREVFKTAKEIDQMDIIQQAADRQPYICQSQSTNIFLPANVSKRRLHLIHLLAWQKGLKTLYYCRSESSKRAEKPSEKVERKIIEKDGCVDGVCSLPLPAPVEDKYESCTSCQ